MSMNTGVSGLNAASKSLNLISNNIANTNTTGYKSLKAQFADIYSANSTSGGVYVSAVKTSFAQGNLQRTASATDLAIEGNGFFIMKDASGKNYYTRAGNFNTDKDGFLVNNHGQRLMGYAAGPDGKPIKGKMVELPVSKSDLKAKATGKIDMTANLDARSKPLTMDKFDPSNPKTYHSTTSTKVYDSLGNEQDVKAYYIKTADNKWTVRYQCNGKDVDKSGNLVKAPAANPHTVELEFDTQGALKSSSTNGKKDAAAGITQLPAINFGNGSAPMSMKMDISSFTQFGNDFSETENKQDGYTAGKFLGINISAKGDIIASYSNGQSKIQGRIALASFPSLNGLAAAGNTSWTETPESGAPIIGMAGEGTLGKVIGGALENSNVNMSAQLVDMIVAQSAYQANTKSISTANENTRHLLNTF